MPDSFETQVAEALQTALMQAGWRNYPTPAIAVDLAPRVAAAIDVAGRMVADGAVFAAADRGAALRALRGETP